MTQTENPSATATGSRGSRSLLAAGAQFSGDLTVPGVLELLGKCDGKISADAIVIETSGSVGGELHASTIAIKGLFEGRIFGGDVKLQSGARVTGDIAYTTLTIESGAEVTSARFSKER
jgi:cytoskeletal protein CcmA (bactofilin family)